MDRSQHSLNKGQLTIFMVMAVVLLFVSAFVFMLYSKNSINLTFTAPSIQEYLDNCLKQTAEDGLELIGKQGGRIQLQDYVPASHYGITYWLSGSTLSIPTTTEMESQLSWFIGNNMGRCINDFEDFEDRGWQVDAGEFSSAVFINHNDVSITATYPLTITQKESALSINQLTSSLPVRLQHIHLAAQIAVQSMQKQEKIDLTALNAAQLNVTIFPYKNALIYQFIDEKSELKNGPFVFNLAVS